MKVRFRGVTAEHLQYAIMAVDPGGTTGVAQMHVYNNSPSKRRKPNRSQHAVGRFRAFEVPVKEVKLSSIEKQFRDLRPFFNKGRPQLYRNWIAHAEWLLDEYIRFRRMALRGYGIKPENTFLIIERWRTLPDSTIPEEALSGLVIGVALAAMGSREVTIHEREGFGRAHFGSDEWAERSVKANIKDEWLERAGLFSRDYSKSARGRVMKHANDATKIALDFCRQTLSIGFVILPYNAEVQGERPEPFKPRWPAATLDGFEPWHATDLALPEPWDPIRRKPKGVKALRKTGHREAAERAKALRGRAPREDRL